MKLPLIEIRRYGKRNWAVYEGGDLLAVTVYKKGAMAILERLSQGVVKVERRAAWFGVSTRTIERRMSMEAGGFCRAYKKGLGRLKVSLRRQQIEAAKKGNATMLIWLGKQLLEQSDKAETASAVTVKNASPAKLTPEDEAFLKRKAELVLK